MIQRLMKSWLLLALCGICDALFAVTILLMSPDGPPFAHSRSMIGPIGALALAAGVCTIAAGIWNSKITNSWLLMLNGLACCALGMMVILGASRPVTFRSIALLVVVMAVSLGLYELITARRLRGHSVDERVLAGAGGVSVGFAVVFLGFVLGWIKLEPSPSGQTFYWLGAYFAFSAICMLGLALGRLRPVASIHRVSPDALPT